MCAGGGEGAEFGAGCYVGCVDGVALLNRRVVSQTPNKGMYVWVVMVVVVISQREGVVGIGDFSSLQNPLSRDREMRRLGT